MLSIRKFHFSMRNACRGLGEAYRHEHSFRVHFLAVLALAVAVWLLGIRGTEAAILFLVAGAVIVIELANSVFERLIDILSPRVGNAVREAKDLMAGAVLVAAITAAAVGLIIIVPHIKL